MNRIEALSEFVTDRLVKPRKHSYVHEHRITDKLTANFIDVAEGFKHGKSHESIPEVLEIHGQLQRHYIHFAGEKSDPGMFIKLAEQLYSIRQLSKSSDPEARKYLEYLSEERVSRNSVVYPPESFYGNIADFNVYQESYLINAKPPLYGYARTAVIVGGGTVSYEEYINAGGGAIYSGAKIDESKVAELVTEAKQTPVQRILSEAFEQLNKK